MEMLWTNNKVTSNHDPRWTPDFRLLENLPLIKYIFYQTPPSNKEPGLLIPLSSSLRTSIIFSTVNWDPDDFSASKFLPQTHLLSGLVSDPLVPPPITSDQINSLCPSHQSLSLATSFSPSLHKSILVVTLIKLMFQSSKLNQWNKPETIGNIPVARFNFFCHPKPVCSFQNPSLSCISNQEGIVITEILDNVWALTSLTVLDQEAGDDLQGWPRCWSSL